LKGDFFFYRNFKKTYPKAVRAEGIYIYDSEGKRYIDGCSGALVTNLGHSVPEIVEAMHEQAKRICFAHTSTFVSEPALELASILKDFAPGDLTHTWFVSGGSEATESAAKMARQYFVERDGASSSKHLIIGRWNSFHGNTLGASGFGGHIPRRRHFLPMLKDFPHVETHYCYRCPWEKEYPSCGVLCARELEREILRVGPQNVAAFIAEPVIGATAGAVVPPPEYWPMVREICDRYDVLLIADEVMTGFGRTGRNFAVEHWNVVPDILVLGKGMGAGYAPLAGTMAREKVARAIAEGSGVFFHGHTYGGNPLSCAVGVAVMRYLLEHNLVERAKTLGERLGAMLKEELQHIPIVGDVRGLGLMWGVELVRDRRTKEPFDRGKRAAEVASQTLMEMGLLVYPGSGMADGVRGDQFLVAPPYTISEGELEEMVRILRSGLEESSRKLL